MKNTYGQSVSVTIFGESHGQEIGAVIDGLAPGIKVNVEYIRNCLELRRPFGKISTARCEADEFRIISGVFNGYTTGAPLAILIPNADTRSKDYSSLADLPRPSHADYTAACKYHGYQDYSGGGHFSGRITAALVAAGALIRAALYENKGIRIETHISRLHGICDRAICSGEDMDILSTKRFPVLDEAAEKKMTECIEAAAKDGDSVGGVLETMITGVPAGVGEPFFDSMESALSHILFSIPGVKGVEFGAGFGICDMLGSEANDQLAVEDDRVVTKTNNNGGINGGITNGMPILFRCAIKPTPSIYKEQTSVRLSEMKEESLKIEGRHDPAIIHRARAVVDAAAAIALADMLAVRYGTDYLALEVKYD